MLSLRTALEQTGTQSMRELQRALSANSSSLRRLILTSHLHHHYLSSGGRQGPLGFPVSDVQCLRARCDETVSRRRRSGPGRWATWSNHAGAQNPHRLCALSRIQVPGHFG